MPQSAGYCHIFQNVTTLMSTIQVTKKWQPKPTKNLVKRFPVKNGKKLQNMVTCIICSSLKTSYILNEHKEPLVLRCIKCGHKSWASDHILYIVRQAALYAHSKYR